MELKLRIGLGSVPNRGIASETCGRVSATRLRNTVSESRIVTPAIKHNVNTPTELPVAHANHRTQLSNSFFSVFTDRNQSNGFLVP